jgi:hypothetical protein
MNMYAGIDAARILGAVEAAEEEEKESGESRESWRHRTADNEMRWHVSLFWFLGFGVMSLEHDWLDGQDLY